MPHTYSRLILHAVFSTKLNFQFDYSGLKSRLCDYIFSIAGLFVLIFGMNLHGFGQLSFSGNGTQTIDFGSTVAGVNNSPYTGMGFTGGIPGAGQLDSDAFAISGFSDGTLAFGGTQIIGDYARGVTTGGVGIGGIYGYSPLQVSNPAMYIQPGGSDFTPGDITLRIQNNGVMNIRQVTVSYDILIRNDGDRANSFNFSHSPDNVAYTSVGAADFTSTEMADTAPTVLTLNRGPIVIAGISVPPGGFFYLRWTGDDAGGTGSRDEFGLDNISVTVQFQPTAASATVAGRVLTDRGRPLRFVEVMIAGGSLAGPLYTTSNMFGRYRFEDIPVGDTYVLSVLSKRYTFKDPDRVVSLSGDLTNVDFIGNEGIYDDSLLFFDHHSLSKNRLNVSPSR